MYGTRPSATSKEKRDNGNDPKNEIELRRFVTSRKTSFAVQLTTHREFGKFQNRINLEMQKPDRLRFSDWFL
jgi:hypothetical protein